MSFKTEDGDEAPELRAFIVPEENQNVALSSEGATMVKGRMSSTALDGNFTDYTSTTGYTSHTIPDESEDPGIVIKLRLPFLLNRLRILLWDGEEVVTVQRSYSYYVEVSVDKREWIKICDHTKYNCRSWQYIAFPRMLVRYIRIVGTYNTRNSTFHVVFVKAYLSRKVAVLDRKWEPNFGILAPTVNVATPAKGARVIEGTHPEALLNGEFTGYTGKSGYTYHQIGIGGICVQLSQPYMISTIRLLLWDLDDRTYGYLVHVSTDRSDWKLVCNRKGQSSWQTVEFEKPLPVLYIRIMGTANTMNNVNDFNSQCFHCVHFECPATQ